ncbi:MAG: helix-turn-helix domain-containing protein [Rhodoferax sp.]|nr:helix-turn-helix domain-containing protein [Rhodoferax sp.]
MLEHKDRLRQALALANKTAGQLQKELGISPAAMTYLLDGATKAFNAANNCKAARFLDVDAFWLATGEGQPRPLTPWPFPMILPGQWAQLDADFRRQIENNVAGEWMRLQQQSASSWKQAA